MSDPIGWLLSLASGLILWTIAAMTAGHRELWDVGAYWTIYLPIAILLAALLGFAVPNRPWRWALIVMLVQGPVVLIASGGGLGLFPLTLVFLAALSIPGVIAAYVGLAARRWVST